MKEETKGYLWITLWIFIICTFVFAYNCYQSNLDNKLKIKRLENERAEKLEAVEKCVKIKQENTELKYDIDDMSEDIENAIAYLNNVKIRINRIQNADNLEANVKAMIALAREQQNESLWDKVKAKLKGLINERNNKE